jgi:hypothetical protein
MYVIEDHHGVIHRLYSTISECWRSSLLRERRHGTYWDLRRSLLRGEAVTYHSFIVRPSRGEADTVKYELDKAEWDAILRAADERRQQEYADFIKGNETND